MLRLEIRRLPPEEQAEMHRLRMTALEMEIPEKALWMFLPESGDPAILVLREPIRLQLRRPRLRICSRRSRRRSYRTLPTSGRCSTHEDFACVLGPFMAPAGPDC